VDVRHWLDAGIRLVHNPNGAFSSLDIFYDAAEVGKGQEGFDDL
jgi:hypothetical protein